MSDTRVKSALSLLQWTVGVVILIEAILFVMPAAFARTHMPGLLRFVLGCGEMVGAVLLLIPRTALRGAWILLVVFGLAIVTHVLHGMYNVGNLLIYAAATWAVAAGK